MTLRAAFALCCACLLLAVQPAVFEEIAATSGVNFRHENSPTKQKYLPETMGGGVALFDFDNDGDLDIFFTNGARIDGEKAGQEQPQILEPAQLSSEALGLSLCT